MIDSTNYVSSKHPHEPEIPPALDFEGRCLVCGLLCQIDELREMEQRIVEILVLILPRMPDSAVHAAEMAVEFAQAVSRDLERDSHILHAVREAVQITAEEDSSAGLCWNAAMQKVTDAMKLDR